jgi:ATP-dependent Clp protease protease subunit
MGKLQDSVLSSTINTINQERPLSNNNVFDPDNAIDSKLLSNGIHYLSGDIAQENIDNAIKWLLYENLDPKEKTLTLFVNSTGGDLYQAFALVDMMNNSKHTIRTIGTGAIMSAAFIIFASGTKGERYISENAGIMCHQFSNTIENKYHDIKAQMKETDLCNARMLEILKQATGKNEDTVKLHLLPASDVYLTAQEMIDAGAADHILK